MIGLDVSPQGPHHADEVTALRKLGADRRVYGETHGFLFALLQGPRAFPEIHPRRFGGKLLRTGLISLAAQHLHVDIETHGEFTLGRDGGGTSARSPARGLTSTSPWRSIENRFYRDDHECRESVGGREVCAEYDRHDSAVNRNSFFWWARVKGPESQVRGCYKLSSWGMAMWSIILKTMDAGGPIYERQLLMKGWQ
jgi:hypothetical protein